MTFFPEAQRWGNSHLSNFVLKIKATRVIPKYIYLLCIFYHNHSKYLVVRCVVLKFL